MPVTPPAMIRQCFVALWRNFIRVSVVFTKKICFSDVSHHDFRTQYGYRLHITALVRLKTEGPFKEKNVINHQFVWYYMFSGLTYTSTHIHPNKMITVQLDFFLSIEKPRTRLGFFFFRGRGVALGSRDCPWMMILDNGWNFPVTLMYYN